MQYKTGTVSTTNGSAVVTGSGTSWLANISVGDLFALQAPSNPYNVAYEVGSVDSDTQITLTAPFNATVSGNAYVLHRDFHPNGNPKFANGDVETAAILNRWTAGTVEASDLGTAAALDITDSPTDTTAGRVMTTGAAGLLRGPSIINSGSMDDLTTPGNYFVGAGTSDKPLASDAFLVSCVSGSVSGLNNRVTQKAMVYASVNANRQFIRSFDGSTWSSWKEIYHTGNLLGTVSQSGGVPTGAVIERGSNSNGEYVKFADGTLICSVSFAVKTVAASSSGVEVWDYPVAFASAPLFSSCNAEGQEISNLQLISSTRITSNASAVRLVVFNESGLSVDIITRGFAIGRWF